MLLEIHPNNPNPRHIATVVDCLKSGGIIAYPTDTIYGLGCDIFQPKAIEKIAQIKGVDPAKAQLSFVCADLSDLSKYTKSISTPLYRLLKNYLPGPFTFILPASKQVPKLLQNKKNTIGLNNAVNCIARTDCIEWLRFMLILILLYRAVLVCSIYQHSIVKPSDLSKVNIAFMTTNGIASVAFALFFLLDYFIK